MMKIPQDILAEISKLILGRHKKNVKANLKSKFGRFAFSDSKIYSNYRWGGKGFQHRDKYASEQMPEKEASADLPDVRPTNSNTFIPI